MGQCMSIPSKWKKSPKTIRSASNSETDLLEKSALDKNPDVSITDWSPWASLSGTLKFPPAVVSTAPGVLYLFAVMNDGQLYMQGYDKDWNGWGGLWFGLGPTNNTLISKPVAVSWGPSRIDVFAVGSTGNNCMHWYWNLGQKSDWEDLGNS